MKPTDNDVADRGSAADAKRKKTNRRVANVVVVVMGVLLYVDLFAQPACSSSTDTVGGGAVDAAAAADASVIDSAVMNIVDASVVDAPPGGGDCFATAIGTTFMGNLGCSLGGMSTLTMVDGYRLAPFGQAQGQSFNPKAGSPNELVATNVVILQQPNHTCTLTCTAGTPKPSLSMTCVHQIDASTLPMCTELYAPQ